MSFPRRRESRGMPFGHDVKSYCGDSVPRSPGPFLWFGQKKWTKEKAAPVASPRIIRAVPCAPRSTGRCATCRAQTTRLGLEQVLAYFPRSRSGARLAPTGFGKPRQQQKELKGICALCPFDRDRVLTHLDLPGLTIYLIYPAEADGCSVHEIMAQCGQLIVNPFDGSSMMASIEGGTCVTHAHICALHVRQDSAGAIF